MERLVQSCDLLGRERDLQPRDLRRADADLGRDPRDGVYDDPALLGRPVPAGRPHAVGGRAAIAEVLARQLTATEGTPGQDAHSKRLGHRQQLALGRALQQRVLELQRGDRRPAPEASDRLGMGGDPRRHVEEADVADLAGGDQVVERSQRLLDRGAWVRSRPAVTSTLIGARTIEQLRANLTS